MAKAFEFQEGFADKAQLQALQAELSSHPLVGPSPLKGSFYQTRGFAITFTRAGIPKLKERFRSLIPFLDATCSKPLAGPKSLWPRRSQAAERATLFYLNLLLVPAGTWVGRHIDATLRGKHGLTEILPRRVSVLWLETPSELEGGKLELFDGTKLLENIQPKEGNLVHFRGDLAHGITPVVMNAEPTADNLALVRASIVCEQYLLAPEELDLFEPFKVQSKAGFSAFLKDAHARSTKTV
jgi:hypothetical protein